MPPSGNAPRQRGGRPKRQGRGGSADAREPPAKRARTVKDEPNESGNATDEAPMGPPTKQQDREGNSFWELNAKGSRRVTISEYAGKTWVNVREYYEKDGEKLPGRKGIMLASEQFGLFVQALPQIEAVLKAKGLPTARPEYGNAGNPLWKDEVKGEVKDEVKEEELFEDEEEHPNEGEDQKDDDFEAAQHDAGQKASEE